MQNPSKIRHFGYASKNPAKIPDLIDSHKNFVKNCELH